MFPDEVIVRNPIKRDYQWCLNFDLSWNFKQTSFCGRKKQISRYLHINCMLWTCSKYVTCFHMLNDSKMYMYESTLVVVIVQKQLGMSKEDGETFERQVGEGRRGRGSLVNPYYESSSVDPYLLSPPRPPSQMNNYISNVKDLKNYLSYCVMHETKTTEESVSF